MTGGDPGVTGVYYDDEYNHNLLPAGTTSCHGPADRGRGHLRLADDLEVTRLDAGQGIPGLQSDRASILQMTGTPQTLLEPGDASRSIRRPASRSTRTRT